MKKMSVKLKVTLWYTLAMIIVLSIILVTMTSISNGIVKRDEYERMYRAVEGMSRQLVDRGGNIRPIPEFMFFGRGVQTALYDGEKNLVGGQPPYGMTQVFDFKEEPEPRTQAYAGNKYLLLDREIKVGEKIYWIRGISLHTDKSVIVQTTFKINIIMIIILICLAALGGYFIISRAFVPVGRISKTAKSIADSSDLTQRINIGEGKDEISALANTFDEMLDKLQQSFEKEKQFTSDASHELRTPIAVIMSECEYMTECAKTTEEFMESADSIKRQTDKMSKLVSELLMISRMDKNTMTLNFEVTDISELLKFVCDEQEELNQNSTRLVRNIRDNVIAKVDRGSMTRLLVNLISNAYKFTEAGGEVTVSLSENKSSVSISVKDSGIGISKDELPKIWERFYQADTARTHSENSGAGLGLSMVKWIAEKHNGKVTVESEPGKGSEFVFTFPNKKQGQIL